MIAFLSWVVVCSSILIASRKKGVVGVHCLKWCSSGVNESIGGTPPRIEFGIVRPLSGESGSDCNRYYAIFPVPTAWPNQKRPQSVSAQRVKIRHRHWDCWHALAAFAGCCCLRVLLGMMQIGGHRWNILWLGGLALPVGPSHRGLWETSWFEWWWCCVDDPEGGNSSLLWSRPHAPLSVIRLNRSR
jgi:hypothetical protein